MQTNRFVLVLLGISSLVVTGPRLVRGQGDPLPLERHVDGETITSMASPSARVTIDRAYRYVGWRRVILSGVADAELHLFVRNSVDGVVESFYWLQFEHFLPANSRSYEVGSRQAPRSVPQPLMPSSTTCSKG